MCGRFEMIYNPGKLQSAVDTISRRNPLHMLYMSVGHPMIADWDVHVAINLVNSDKEVNMMSWDVIHRATQEDRTMLKLMDHIQRGMPDSGLELDKSLREHHRFRQYLHVVDGVLCYRDLILVPAALRAKVLAGVYAAYYTKESQGEDNVLEV
jgi:hypothetical protein